jgi:hypothetical protein
MLLKVPAEALPGQRIKAWLFANLWHCLLTDEEAGTAHSSSKQSLPLRPNSRGHLAIIQLSYFGRALGSCSHLQSLAATRAGRARRTAHLSGSSASRPT